MCFCRSRDFLGGVQNMPPVWTECGVDSGRPHQRGCTQAPLVVLLARQVTLNSVPRRVHKLCSRERHGVPTGGALRTLNSSSTWQARRFYPRASLHGWTALEGNCEHDGSIVCTLGHVLLSALACRGRDRFLARSASAAAPRLGFLATKSASAAAYRRSGALPSVTIGVALGKVRVQACMP